MSSIPSSDSLIQSSFDDYGLCACGCGEATPIANRNLPKYGIVKGQPLPYIPSHRIPRHSHPQVGNNPVLCACGCGQPTGISAHTNAKKGIRAGQPARYVKGHNHKPPALARLMSKVIKPADPDACWGWRGATSRFGYGTLKHNGRFYNAHRAAYELLIGPIPDEMIVMHLCDNPPCCNPRHLRVGTLKDNTQDMLAKGRHRIVGNKVGPKEVRQIRDLRRQGYTLARIAEMYGITLSNVSCIVLYKSWKHIE